MKPHRSVSLIAFFMTMLVLVSGCGRKESAPEAEEREEGRVKVCGFKEGRGVFVGDESRKALRLATMDVVPKTIPQTIRGTARVFARGKATILVDTNMARAIKAGQRVALAGQQEGIVAGIENAWGHVEVIVEFAGEALSPGANVAAELRITASPPLPAVPESSVLRAATGDYVFVANGEHYLRTPVKLAGQSEGWVTISDGLLEGDVVVTNGVEGLWCIELQATKGGYACCAIAKKE
jgi:multidrug efflux pump subunit AcrA (membrane-fusion protein)